VHDYALVVLPRWLLTGIGSGLSLPALIGAATVGLPAAMGSVGSGHPDVPAMGTVIGSALLIAVLGAAATTGTTARYLDTWWIAVAVCLAGGVVTVVGFDRRQDAATAATLTVRPEQVPVHDG
jgi:hypothetical protein